MNHRIIVASVASAMLLLAGCGAAETASVAATQAEHAAEQIKQGQETQAKIEKDLAAAQQAAAEMRERAEADTQ